jgi:hypothetical protein
MIPLRDATRRPGTHAGDHRRHPEEARREAVRDSRVIDARLRGFGGAQVTAPAAQATTPAVVAPPRVSLTLDQAVKLATDRDRPNNAPNARTIGAIKPMPDTAAKQTAPMKAAMATAIPIDVRSKIGARPYAASMENAVNASAADTVV